MHILFYLGVILLAGLIGSKIASLLKLPDVTGYLVAGVLIGPSLFHIIPHDISARLTIVSEVALGFIAYSIGSEFNFNHLKKVGNSIILITIFEALGAVLLINLSMLFIFQKSVPFSLVIGAIAAATAPAATLMVIRQYKAKGPLVDTLLPIVAIDDAVGIIVFGISITIAKALVFSNGEISLFSMIAKPFIEIILAIVIGIGVGIILSYIANKAKGQDRLLTVSIGIIFACIGIATEFDLSPLLLCMSLGATVTNTVPNSKRVLTITDRVTPPVFVAFFTIAGAELNVRILADVGLVGIGYIILRMLGKMAGASLGAKIAHCPKNVQKYLGFTLVPQAGVAIGLAMAAETVLPTHGAEIRVIILAATVVYELIGPLMTKFALFKAGEAQIAHIPSTKQSANAHL